MPCSVTARPLTGRFCGPGPSWLATATAIVAITAHSASCQGWSDPVTTTPSFIQKQFGPAGGVLPGQGESYCGPVTLSMGLYYLGHNGYTQLAPASYTAGNVADEAAAANLALIIGGLAGTSATGGTYALGLESAIETYLAAKGISAARFTFTSTQGPAPAWFAQEVLPNWQTSPAPDEIVFTSLMVGWYTTTGQPDTYARRGGHFVGVVAADQATGDLTTFNPYPSSFDAAAPNAPSSNPQLVGSSFLPADWIVNGQSGLTTYSQLQSGTTLGDASPLKAIMEVGQAWSVARSALPSDPGYGIDDWAITTTKLINTNAGSLDVLARLTGAGGIAKAGLGSLTLTADNQLTGVNQLSGGTLASSLAGGSLQAPGTPFGTGAILGTMSSVLAFTPDDTTPGDIVFSLASGPGAIVQIDGGGMELHLARGGNQSLTVTVGSHTDGLTPNVLSRNSGHCEILVGDGLAALGGTTKLFVAGTADNLPAVTNGMVLPLLLGKDNDPAESASFLTYAAADGFLPATPVLSSATGINDPGVTAATIYRADSSQTVAPAGAAVYALEVSAGETVSGSGTLAIGPGTGVAGLILNGGTVAAPTAFGTAGAVVLANLQGGTISGPITGSGGLIKAGRGPLVLTADSPGLSGSITVNEGTLVAANATGSATGAADISLQSDATLRLDPGGSVGGPVTVGFEGILSLAGGTAAGDVTVAAPSGVERGGTIEGFGTISGTATIQGDIQAGTTPGTIRFDGPATLTGASFSWRLDSLADDATSLSGSDWNRLSFYGPAALGDANTQLNLFVEFADGLAPRTDMPFWTTAHSWQIFDMHDQWMANTNLWNGSFEAGTFSISFDSPTGIGTLGFMPVPEPASLLAGLATLIGVATASRLRRRSAPPRQA